MARIRGENLVENRRTEANMPWTHENVTANETSFNSLPAFIKVLTLKEIVISKIIFFFLEITSFLSFLKYSFCSIEIIKIVISNFLEDITSFFRFMFVREISNLFENIHFVSTFKFSIIIYLHIICAIKI